MSGVLKNQINTISSFESYCGFCLFTAEDPSENYVKLRDYVLVKLCQGLPSFAVDKLHLGFSADMIKEAQDKLKINKVPYEGAAVIGLQNWVLLVRKKRFDNLCYVYYFF